MTKLCLCITDGSYNYGLYLVKRNCVTEKNTKIPSNGKKIEVDSAFWHYLYKELVLSDMYRTHFIHHWILNTHTNLIMYILPTRYNLVDYNWNEKVYYLVRERCELDHALSWLSTLGGAFSALGDYFANCAETAGKISFHQLQLAVRLGDPSIASRCRLYLSLSLIQKKRYKHARRIIESEYENAKGTSVVDPKLLNMCKVWQRSRRFPSYHETCYFTALSELKTCIQKLRIICNKMVCKMTQINPVS